MAKGRGSGAIMLLLCILVLYSEMVHAKTFVVGDEAGWTFNVTDWSKGKRFKAGDILEFNYDPKVHNLVKVDGDGYSKCKGEGRKIYESGHDRFVLGPGVTYFICTIPHHCKDGRMEIGVYVPE